MRYQVLRLKEDHPITGAAKAADDSEHGSSRGGNSGRVSDSEIIDTQARSPLDQVVCYAPYYRALEVAALLNREHP